MRNKTRVKIRWSCLTQILLKTVIYGIETELTFLCGSYSALDLSKFFFSEILSVQKLVGRKLRSTAFLYEGFQCGLFSLFHWVCAQ